jgi:hypothetical protein
MLVRVHSKKLLTTQVSQKKSPLIWNKVMIMTWYPGSVALVTVRKMTIQFCVSSRLPAPIPLGQQHLLLPACCCIVMAA